MLRMPLKIRSPRKSLYRPGPGFTVLAQGAWGLERVRADWSATSRTRRKPVMEACIDNAWSAALQRAGDRGQILFTTDLVGLDHVFAASGTLSLRTVPTSYRDYVGTNKNITQLRSEFSEREWAAALANPLALCVCLHSQDGYLLVARRSARTYDHPGYYHVPGGHIEVDRHVFGDRVDLRLALQDELSEELGIATEQLRDVLCTGVIADAQSRKPELLMTARLRLGHHDLQAPYNDEHGSLRWLVDSPQSLARFLLQHNRSLVPAGKACLLFFGRWRYGAQWYRRLDRCLRLGLAAA
jgi:8-oxo-dGTP pyrophosphatase MutT (NUDIX family)